MKVLFVASECAPFFKLGGLGDVAGSLPKALGVLGTEITVAMPYFSKIREEFGDGFVKQGEFVVHFGEPKRVERVVVWQGRLPDSTVPILFFENESHLSLYVSEADFGDQQKIINRFLFFSSAVVEFLDNPDFGRWDVVHMNDWHTSMVAALLKAEKMVVEPKTLLTVHNLSYKGRSAADVLDWFSSDLYHLETVSWDIGDGVLNCLKQGIVNSDFINAVSPTYAKEIQTKEYGEGMDEILKAREGRVKGILNGIDTDFWNPKADKFLAVNYGLGDWEEGKMGNKKGLLKELKLLKEENDEGGLVFGMVTRLTSQKGVEVAVEGMRRLLVETQSSKLKSQNYKAKAKSDDGEVVGVRFVVLGQGEKELEERVVDLAREFPENVFVKLGFDEVLAHLVYAGSDFFLVPSRFEPCGLTQMIAMRYGSVPIVRKTGGLADTVTDKETGYVFEEYNSDNLYEKLREATEVYSNDFVRHGGMVKKGMEKDFSWDKSAREYLELYGRMMGVR